ncbi:hypothetical protein [Actinophytocola sp. NPDC049390]|uniref:hypothetical protein n=1 Tax=Actinophytocola sp. NPDC049390 TaxID=3363894 RepID=UPI0037B2B326
MDELTLPTGWLPVPPAEVGLDAELLAIKADTHGSGFTATIVVDGAGLAPGETLADLADRSAAALPTGIVVGRDAAGPRLTQSLRLTHLADDVPRRVVRVEEYLALPDRSRPGWTGVLRAVSTATVEQADAVAADFTRLLAGLDGLAANA